MSTADGINARIARIYQTTLDILVRAREEQRATSEFADSMARRLLNNARVGRRPSPIAQPPRSW